MKHRWLATATSAAWWALPDSCIRVAMALASLVEQQGSPVVELTGDRLAELCRTSRSSARRALESLAEAGFCELSHREGRGGTTTVTVNDRGQFNTQQHQQVESEFVASVASKRGQFKRYAAQEVSSEDELTVDSSTANAGSDAGQFINTPNHYEKVEEYLAAQGYPGQFRGQLNRQRTSVVSTEIEEDVASLASLEPEMGNFAPFSPRARDQDLLRSSKKDLRSSALEYKTRSTVAARMLRDAAPQKQSQDPPKDPMDNTPPVAPAPPPTSIEPTSPGKHKRKRTDPSKIPERAWAAADYLRAQTLAKNGAAVAGMRPWEYGWSWESGKAIRLGDGSRTGLRLSWANSFRLFHAVLQGALANGGQPSTEDYTWNEIAKAIQWVFHGQPPGVGFVIECPDTLRAKWDRIDACRKSSTNQRASQRPSQTGPAMLRPKLSDDDLPPGVRRSR